MTQQLAMEMEIARWDDDGGCCLYFKVKQSRKPIFRRYFEPGVGFIEVYNGPTYDETSYFNNAC